MKKSLILAIVISVVLISFISNSHTFDAKAQTNSDLLHVELGSGSRQITYANVSEPVYFSAVVTGGVPPYRYQWYYQPYEFGNAATEATPLGNFTEGDSSANFMFLGTSPAWYLISVRVWDSVGNEKYFWAMPIGIWVSVSGEPLSSPNPTPTVTPSPSLYPTSSPIPTPTQTPSPSPSPSPTMNPSSSQTPEPTAEQTQSSIPTLEPKNSINSLPPITGIVIIVIIAVSGILVYFFKRPRDLEVKKRGRLQ
jgi:hypothetical protein